MSLAVLHVVVPAHDEEHYIARCLRAVAVAVAAVTARHPALDVRVTVVLDSCTDGTAALVSGLGVDTVAIEGRNVGAARSAGVAHARRLAAGTDPERVWIATTDADSVAPASWLLDHIRLAHDHDLVVGRVTPDPDELSPAVLREWRLRHPLDGLHVHGANLGVRLSAYDAVGGFQQVVLHEDVGLVSALRAAGRSWVRGSEVVTSARLVNRVSGGFAGYLAALTAVVD